MKLKELLTQLRGFPDEADVYIRVYDGSSGFGGYPVTIPLEIEEVTHCSDYNEVALRNREIKEVVLEEVSEDAN